jgi:hypothetical protein
MNIDTLRTSNGYRTAQYIDVVRCLNADHVTHLQRDNNVVAIRPTAGGWNIERAPNGITEGTSFWSKEEQREAIRAVLLILNGTANNYSVGDETTVEANQGEREAYVLATIGDSVLVEYFMPNGTTALRVMKVLGLRQLDHSSISYAAVPKRWINAMYEQGTDLWEGRGQRARNPIPFPPK